MADTTQTPAPLRSRLAKIDKGWLAVVLIPLALLLVDPEKVPPAAEIVFGAMSHTGIFIVIAITLVAYVKASGADNLIAKAFQGNQVRMIILAALMGGLSPFCSCEVIPFIAALLAVGAPLGAVMAFWLASPLMDPAMFTITVGELGWDFAIAKTAAAIGIGLMGGFLTMTFAKTPVFAEPLREKPQVGGCCGSKTPFSEKPKWDFWGEAERRDTFRNTWLENALFLVKWLLIAYMFEALMIVYDTTAWVGQFLGGEGFGTILISALIGMPAYLNGFAAVGFISGLMDQGMSNGAAMSFVIAGGVSCIPAAIAVWALVKPRIFAAYIGFALTGAVIAGTLYQAFA